MSDQTASKNDITAVFKRLRGIPSNKVCFDCGAKNPTWASVTYGVFICMDCSAVHRSLGVHLTFVRSTQLDINWRWLQLRAMQVGGNSNAMSFFQQHGCSSTDAQQKYNSRAAQLYREKLHHQAATAIRLYGTKLHIDVPHVEQPHSPEQREVDFFKEHEDAILFQKETFLGGDLQNGSPAATTPSQPVRNDTNGRDIGPNVEAALNISPTEAQKQMETRKPTIASRKPAAAKKGLGSRKGLGAQKVSTNFNEIEKEAQKADQQREQTVIPKQQPQIPVSSEDEEKQLASVRLAYKDLGLQQKQTEEKLRQTDPKKAEQLERLGMGFAGVRGGGITHSAASEMKIITQETPSQPSRNRDLDLDDDFEFISFTSGPPKYGDSPFLSRSSSERFSDLGSKGSWSSDKSDRKSSVEMLLSSEKDPSSGRSRKSASGGSTPVSSTDEAQRKFGNAKAISSEQYFGSSRDSEFERRANLTRFEGSNSISSEDYFGDGSSHRNPSPSYSGPNLYDIKEGVKDGVTKVAGRLSSLANGVMNSLQDRYGY